MKSISRKSLLAVLVTALLAVVCAFCAINYAGNAYADDTVDIPSGTINEVDEGFTVLDSARVNISAEKKGIKFETEITKSFYESLTGDVEFIAVVTNTVNSKQVAVKFKNLPDFETEDTDILNTYLNYQNLQEGQEKAMFAAELKVETYAKVTNGSAVSYYKAANAPQRSMRAVANAAWLNYTDETTDGFDKSAVEKYFGTAVRDSEVNAYTFADGTLMAKLPADAPVADKEGNLPAGTSVYVGTTAIAAEDVSYDANVGRYKVDYEAAKNLKLGDESEISVFDANGNVYTTNAIQANKLTQANFTDLIAKTSGVYVLAEDIDMGKIDTDSDDATTQSWANSGTFNGAFDGQGYVIDKMNNSSLFHYLGNATVKNIVFSDAITPNAGVISNQVRGNVHVSNVVAEIIETKGAAYGCFVGWQTDKNSELVLENCFVADLSFKTGDNVGALVTYGVDKIRISNVFVSSAAPVLGTNLLGTNDSFLTVTEFKNIDGSAEAKNGVDYVKVDSVGALKDIIDAETGLKPSAELISMVGRSKMMTALNDDNISILQSATRGYFYLENNIDLSKYPNWRTSFTVTSADPFRGEFDGRGKTISGMVSTASSASGIFGEIGPGAMIHNVVVEYGDISGVRNAAIFGTNRNKNITGAYVTIENVVVKLNKFNSYGSGLICCNLDSNLTVNNVLIYVKDAAGNTNASLLFGNYNGKKVATVNNFYLVAEKDSIGKYYIDGQCSISGTVNQVDAISKLDSTKMPSGLAKDFVLANTPAA